MFSRRQFGLTALGFVLLPATAARAQSAAAAFTITPQRILMDVRLNGQGPLPFVVDSGATISAIREDKARELGLRPLGRLRADSGLTFPTYVADEMVIGDAVRQNAVQLMGLPGLNLGGDGLLAAGLLTRFNGELDFDQRQWRVHPAGVAPPVGFERLPGRLRNFSPGLSNLIYADARIGHETISCILDTGAPRSLALSHEWGVRLGLDNPALPYAPVQGGGGVGPGSFRAKLVRAPSLQLGSFVFDAPLTLVRPPGAYGQPAIIGLELLRGLNLWVDGPGGKVFARRNQSEPVSVPYPASGIWVEHETSGVTVKDVGTGSPGAKAGVRAGDILEGLSLKAAIDLINVAPGVQVHLPLRRPEGVVEVAFTNAAYL